MAVISKALVLGGKTGLVGQALVETLEKSGCEVTAAGREDGLDYFSSGFTDAIAKVVDRCEPQVIFNTTGYTQVDKAEDDIDAAVQLNRTVPLILARIVKERGLGFVQYSTDFVFDGKASSPYTTEDATNPQCVYGQTKREGEEAILAMNLPLCAIIRTAWLFGPGKKNFVSTILGLAKGRDSINVVHDQVGSPTYTVDLAQYTLKLVESEATGLFHIVNSGSASWCDLAHEAVRLAELGCTVNAIPSTAYPMKARRPSYSVLDTSAFSSKTGIIPRPWNQALRDYIYREILSVGV